MRPIFETQTSKCKWSIASLKNLFLRWQNGRCWHNLMGPNFSKIYYRSLEKYLRKQWTSFQNTLFDKRIVLKLIFEWNTLGKMDLRLILNCHSNWDLIKIVISHHPVHCTFGDHLVRSNHHTSSSNSGRASKWTMKWLNIIEWWQKLIKHAARSHYFQIELKSKWADYN